MKLVIHIGLQKTGTTFLQRNFLARAKELQAQGLCYPHPGSALPSDHSNAGHHWLAAAIAGVRPRFIPDADFSYLPAHVAALRRTMEESGAKVGLISSENLSRLTPDAIDRLKSHFDGMQTEIVVYLRRQDLWIDSLHGQRIKTGSTADLSDTIAAESALLDYVGFLKPWVDRFGSDAIRVGVYEGFDDPRALWRDFLTLIGCPEAASVAPAIETANVTLAPVLSRFMEAAQPPKAAERRLRKQLERINPQFRGSERESMIGADAARDLLARHAEGNAAIARTYLGRDQLFLDMEITEGRGSADLTVQELARITAALLLENEPKRSGSSSPAGRLNKLRDQVRRLVGRKG